MDRLRSAYQGCLLGLAAGDALGYTVDSKSYEEICRDYGPRGLMGYDLVNGYAQISSYTQIAAFVTNALLLGITQGQQRGQMSPFVRYIQLAMLEWANSQTVRRGGEPTRCWVGQVSAFRQRACMDYRMLDTLQRRRIGSMEEPMNRGTSPAALTAAIPVGLFFHPDRMEVTEIGTLGAQAVALTQGDAVTFLSGAALSYMIAGIVQEPDCPLELQFSQAADAVAGQFGREYNGALELRSLLYKAIHLAKNANTFHPEAMQQLRCGTSAQVLAGAVYACLASAGDFDTAMVIAVNHGGRSAGVGAVAGALLGAQIGVEALPDFYLEGLETAPLLLTLAADIAQGCPMGMTTRLFDDDWDRKYTQGEAPEPVI